MNCLNIQLLKFFAIFICIAFFNPTQAQPTTSFDVKERHLATNCNVFKYEVFSNPNAAQAAASFGNVVTFFLGAGSFELNYQPQENFVGLDSIVYSYWEDPVTMKEGLIVLHVYPCDTPLGNSDNCEPYEFEITSINNAPVGSAPNGTFDYEFVGNNNYNCTYLPNEGFEGIENLEVIYWESESMNSVNHKINVSNCEETVPTAINEINAFEGKIFPNPTRDQLIIQEIPENVRTIQIIDLTGRIVMNELATHNQQHELSLQYLEKGIYVLILRGKNSYRQIITKM